MTQKLESRPKALNRLMIVPAVVALGLVAATLLLVYKMSEDKVANGDRVQMHWSGQCLTEAKSILTQRVDDVGLGEPIWQQQDESLILQATLPNIPNATDVISSLLTHRGVWQLKDNDEVLLSNQDISQAKLSLDESGMPEVLLTFHKAAEEKAQEYLLTHRDGMAQILLDNEKVIDRPNTIDISQEFRLVSEERDPHKRMQESVDFVILLSHGVIPCDLTLKEVKVI